MKSIKVFLLSIIIAMMTILQAYAASTDMYCYAAKIPSDYDSFFIYSSDDVIHLFFYSDAKAEFTSLAYSRVSYTTHEKALHFIASSEEEAREILYARDKSSYQSKLESDTLTVTFAESSLMMSSKSIKTKSEKVISKASDWVSGQQAESITQLRHITEEADLSKVTIELIGILPAVLCFIAIAAGIRKAISFMKELLEVA